MNTELIEIGKISTVLVSEYGSERMVRTFVQLRDQTYNIYDKKIYIYVSGKEYEFDYFPSTYSGTDRNIAPINFREAESIPFDYIGCVVYTKKNY